MPVRIAAAWGDGTRERTWRLQSNRASSASVRIRYRSAVNTRLRLSESKVGTFVGTNGLDVAVFWPPIAGVPRFDVTAPLVVFLLVILGWLSLGAVQGVLSLRRTTGLGPYAGLP